MILVNELNRIGSRSLLKTPRIADDPFCDVNGDGFSSPIDVLIVINALNRHPNPMTVVSGVTTESDFNGTGVVLRDQVVVVGQSLPNVAVDVFGSHDSESAVRVIADEVGNFSNAIDC